MANFITKIEGNLTQSRKVAKPQRFHIGLINSPYFCLTFATLRLCVFALILPIYVTAQKVAVLTPDKSDVSHAFAEKLETSLSEKLKIFDDSLSESAYLSILPAAPFNLTTHESKRIGSAIGCDIFILMRVAVQRRSSFQRPEYYESYAEIYVVSSRTGRLVFWKLQRFESERPEKSDKMLADSVASLASEITDKIRTAIKGELAEPDPTAMEELPDENSTAAKNFRAPIPYRRIKPDYTAEASLYRTEATVELQVDLDAKGVILKTEVVRWAGFGLDESVDKAVRSMNWRPAMRDGKPLPMRFLVRYNFKKLEQ